MNLIMQIQSINSQSFSGLHCYPNYGQIEYVLATKLNCNGFIKADKLLEKLSKNKANADVFLGGNVENPRIYAEVAGKTFKENFFFGPLTVLKRALKKSNEDSQIELIADVIKTLAKDLD